MIGGNPMQRHARRLQESRRRREQATGNTARLRLVLLSLLVTVLLASSAWGLLRSGTWAALALHLAADLGTAMLIGALVVYAIGRREEEGDRADLIARLGSATHGEARSAARELRRRGWLGDGSLRGAALRGARLALVDLAWANLSWADLAWADLQAAGLRGAVVRGADLAGADLREADLQDADLSWAHLRGADLAGAELNVRTVLPDGLLWAPTVDLARFTNPEHAEFWEPRWREGEG
jgi:hypothetical protein